MACLKNYQENLSFATFNRVHSNSKKVSELFNEISILIEN